MRLGAVKKQEAASKIHETVHIYGETCKTKMQRRGNATSYTLLTKDRKALRASGASTKILIISGM